MNTTNNFLFFVIFAQSFDILPKKLANFGHLHTDVIANKCIKILNYHCAKLYTITSTDMGTTIIFQIFRVFPQNFTFIFTQK